MGMYDTNKVIIVKTTIPINVKSYAQECLKNDSITLNSFLDNMEKFIPKEFLCLIEESCPKIDNGEKTIQIPKLNKYVESDTYQMINCCILLSFETKKIINITIDNTDKDELFVEEFSDIIDTISAKLNQKEILFN